MDPLNSNDVHSPDENFVEADSNWQGRTNQIYIIDARLKLFKIKVARESILLASVDLSLRELHIRHDLEKHLRFREFPRVCVTDHCLTLDGHNYNTETGYKWDFILAGLAGKKLEHEIEHCEHLPFSN